MKAGHPNTPVRDFDPPAGVYFARATPERGTPARPGTPGSMLIPFKRGTLPSQFARGEGKAQLTDQILLLPGNRRSDRRARWAIDVIMGAWARPGLRITSMRRDYLAEAQSKVRQARAALSRRRAARRGTASRCSATCSPSTAASASPRQEARARRDLLHDPVGRAGGLVASPPISRCSSRTPKRRWPPPRKSSTRRATSTSCATTCSRSTSRCRRSTATRTRCSTELLDDRAARRQAARHAAHRRVGRGHALPLGGAGRRRAGAVGAHALLRARRGAPRRPRRLLPAEAPRQARPARSRAPQDEAAQDRDAHRLGHAPQEAPLRDARHGQQRRLPPRHPPQREVLDGHALGPKAQIRPASSSAIRASTSSTTGPSISSSRAWAPPCPRWQRAVINFVDELSRVGDRALRMAA